MLSTRYSENSRHFLLLSTCIISHTLNHILDMSPLPSINNEHYCLQGVTFEKLQKEMAALAQKRCIFDPKLIKPKYVCLHFPAVCLQFSIKLPPLKHILALPTKVQKCTFSELQPFTIVIFQMVHPVLNRKK